MTRCPSPLARRQEHGGRFPDLDRRQDAGPPGDLRPGQRPVFSIDVAGRPIRGNPAAKVTVINFDDLECPYCARMHQTLFPATLERYKDKVRFIYKDDPLVEIHPWAMHAAVDANCLAAQSGEVYWTYVDYIHSHGQEDQRRGAQPAKSFAALDRIARQEATLGKLDGARLDACLAKQDETQVRASMRKRSRWDGRNARRCSSMASASTALPEEQVWMVIDRALRAAGVEPPAAPPAAPAAPCEAFRGWQVALRLTLSPPLSPDTRSC
jgi:glutaredoxin